MVDRNTIPPTLSDLLVKLGYLASIPNQKKACFSDLSYVDAKSLQGAYKRFWGGENRKSMLTKVNQIIDQAVDDIDKYNGTQYLPLLVTKLANSEIGINNLIDTYQSDPGVILQLQVCKTKIEIKLKPFRKLIDPKVSDENLESNDSKKNNIDPDDVEL